MKKIGDILNSKYGGKTSLTREQLISLRVCAAWDGVIVEIDKKYLPETKALKFSHGKLTVGVTTSGYLMELSMLRMIILEKYDEVLGSGVVEEIKFRLGF
ncbi:MAG: DUF721 domain-containing protein [Patescibacteria group bacterium]